MKLKNYTTILLLFLIAFTNLNAEEPEKEPTIMFTPPKISTEGTDIYGNSFFYSPDDVVSFYSLENGNLFYKDSVDGYYLTKTKLENVDKASFKDLGLKYAKDKKNVYFEGSKIEGEVDATTFQIITFEEEKNSYIKSEFAKDKNHVFSMGYVINNSDSKTFKKISPSHYADKNHVYDWLGGMLEDANPKDFKYIDFSYFISNGHVYYDNYLIEDIDAATFEKIDEYCNYYKDKNLLYTQGSAGALSGSNPNSYRKLSKNCDYLESNGIIYCMGNIIEGADVNSFEVIGDYSNFAKDKNHVYHNWEILENANPKTFRFLDREYFEMLKKEYGLSDESFIKGIGEYSTDENNIYIFGTLIEYADPKTFRFIADNSYACDSEKLYHYTSIVCPVDGKSFARLDDNFFKDNYKLYYITSGFLQALIDVDGKTIRKLSDNWFADKDNVYYLENLGIGHSGTFHCIDGLDASTFHIIDNETIKDKNGTYNIVEILSKK